MFFNKANMCYIIFSSCDLLPFLQKYLYFVSLKYCFSADQINTKGSQCNFCFNKQ